MKRRHRPWLALCALFLLAAGFPGEAGARAKRRTPAEARYLQQIHPLLHAFWVRVVLSRVQTQLDATDPFNAPGRKVVVRFRFGPDGELRSATVRQSSGLATFDTTARAVAFGVTTWPKPPAALRSDDGDVYVDWTFHRHRPWCHDSTARVVRLDFTSTTLARGEIREAGRRLEAAINKGQLRRYAREFGWQLVLLAARRGGVGLAPELARLLDLPNLPSEVLRRIFGGSLSDAQLAAAAQRLALQRHSEVDALLAMLFRMSDRPAHRRAYLDALRQRPAAAKACGAELRAALRDADAGVAARAAAVVWGLGGRGDREAAEAVLSKLLETKDPRARREALGVLGRPVGSPALGKVAVRLAQSSALPKDVAPAATAALGALGTPEAIKALVGLTYTKRTWLAHLAVQGLLGAARAPLAACYRYASLLKGARTPPALLALAAEGLGRQCLTPMRMEIRKVGRHVRSQARAGLARGLPVQDAEARRLLVRLSEDRVTPVRLAALETLLRNRPREAAARLRRAESRWDPKEVPLLCRYTRTPAALRRCFAAAPPARRRAVAIRTMAAAPDAVTPWLLTLLREDRWPSRLLAARLLLVVPPAR